MGDRSFDQVEAHDLNSVQVAEYFTKCDGLEDLPLRILSFWFGPVYDGATITPEAYDLWFGKSEETDAMISSLFKSYLVDAGEGKFDHWCQTPWGTLALVILMDQFPRNIFRNNKESFKYDWKAQYEVRLALEKHQDDALTDLEKVWFYLVLTHSEDLHAQEQCVRLATQKLVNMPEMFQKMWNTIFEKHLIVIRRFHRFPHRNKFMLRESTEEEAEFLADPTFRFDLPVVLIIDPVTQQAKFIFKTGAEEQESSKQSVLERTDTTDLVLRQDVKFCQFCDASQSSCPHSMDKEKSHSAVLKCSAKFLSALTRRKSSAALALDDSESAPSHQDAQPMTEVALGEVVAETHDLDHSFGKVETADSQPRMRLSRTLTSAWRNRNITAVAA